ncbi:hypothetical protein [Nonomuraea salmonea]|uniref:Uncharacterized protein n=1 Tax=Nonomuraea salmonea TaxID=46181 RepID=A0ABV5P2S0_9ACTN
MQIGITWTSAGPGLGLANPSYGNIDDIAAFELVTIAGGTRGYHLKNLLPGASVWDRDAYPAHLGEAMQLAQTWAAQFFRKVAPIVLDHPAAASIDHVQQFVFNGTDGYCAGDCLRHGGTTDHQPIFVTLHSENLWTVARAEQDGTANDVVFYANDTHEWEQQHRDPLPDRFLWTQEDALEAVHACFGCH